MPVTAATAAIVGAVAAVVGTAVSVVGSISQGNAQAAAARAQGQAQRAAFASQAEASRYNAEVARQNAEYIRQAGAIEEEKQREKGRRLLGTQQALYGKAGVTGEGTPLEIMADTAMDLEKEALTIRYNYDIQVRRALSEADQYDFMGARSDRMGMFAGEAADRTADMMSSAGYWKAGTSLLTGLGHVATIYGGMKVPTLGTSGYDYKPGGKGFKDWE